MSYKNSSKKSLYISLVALVLFTGLMVYALNRDANYVPSQLVGQQAPTMKAPTAQGFNFDFQSLLAQRRWVIVNFWSTTCVVCRHEAPELERFWRENVQSSNTGPLFVSVNTQDRISDILNYQREFSLSFPVVADLDGKISLDYGVYGTPETFFIDPSGLVRHRVAGDVDQNTILAFIEWLEKNPGISPIQAIEGFGQVRAGLRMGG